jgi:plasmid rolling circle replication initiator protein Rep
MFGDIDNIRKDINDTLQSLECGKEIHSYFGDYKTKHEKVTREEAESAIVYFLELARVDVDNRLTNYLYSEAQVLKDTLARIDHYTDED